MNTEILLDHEPVADGSYLVRALLRIPGEAPAAADRPPLNLALVLDRSGSMGAMGKLGHAKEAAGLLVRRIAEEDSVALVAYDTEVTTVAGRTVERERGDLVAGHRSAPRRQHHQPFRRLAAGLGSWSPGTSSTAG